MLVNEIITEAHHSRLATQKIGPWTVHFDSHLMATIPARQISLPDITNIITYACITCAADLKTIPRGAGAFFQDTNTLISIYIRRNQHYPDQLTIETVLSPEMTPKPPLFRRPVPPHNMKINKNDEKRMAYYHQQVQLRGRDAVSQDLENAKFGQKKPELMSPVELDKLRQQMNREQRRELDRYLRKKGVGK